MRVMAGRLRAMDQLLMDRRQADRRAQERRQMGQS